jgi:hypothetical protein
MINADQARQNVKDFSKNQEIFRLQAIEQKRHDDYIAWMKYFDYILQEINRLSRQGYKTYQFQNGSNRGPCPEELIYKLEKLGFNAYAEKYTYPQYNPYTDMQYEDGWGYAISISW